MTKRTQHDSPDKTCTEDGCDRPLRAKGLCVTHYNQTQPNRHTLVAMTCDGCGATMRKEASRRERYAKLYCTELCRQWDRFGAWSTKLPSDHWARQYGATCTIALVIAFDCEWCGAHYLTTKPAQRFCSRLCKVKQGKATRRGREHNSVGTYSWAQIARLWRSFDGCCAYCRTPTPLPDIQAEHVIALSNGGANNLSNLLPSCGPCNADKRDLSLDEWSASRVRRKLPTVTTSWEPDDTRYAHLATGRTLVRTAA